MWFFVFVFFNEQTVEAPRRTSDEEVETAHPWSGGEVGCVLEDGYLPMFAMCRRDVHQALFNPSGSGLVL